MKAVLYAVFLVAMLAGCAASTPVVLVPDAEGIESVSAIAMTCGKPWELTRDCSNFSGGTKALQIGGVEMKVAGNAKGDTIVLLGTTAQGSRGYTSNLAYEAIKKVLKDAGIGIVKVTPVVSAGQLFGYGVEADAPAYDLLDRFAKK